MAIFSNLKTKVISEPKNYEILFRRHQGVRLDIGCGLAKQPGYIGMDIREIPQADIIHNLEHTPWPIPDDCAVIILMSHILEHVDPRNMLAIMAEVYRVGKPNCQVQISTPYAGSFGAYQDPTHVRPGFNEATWTYFDPRQPLWEIYQPPAFFIERCNWDLLGNIEVIMRVVKDKKIVDECINMRRRGTSKVSSVKEVRKVRARILSKSKRKRS